jgi:1-aminocyclopropane-1-carboxylate deaminase/D-cysteine desulfhydrase-like pyridoxal-dependent ACC family enzyme
MGEPESTNKESIRVYIPRDQVFDARALKIIMDKIRKEEFLNG